MAALLQPGGLVARDLLREPHPQSIANVISKPGGCHPRCEEARPSNADPTSTSRQRPRPADATGSKITPMVPRTSRASSSRHTSATATMSRARKLPEPFPLMHSRTRDSAPARAAASVGSARCARMATSTSRLEMSAQGSPGVPHAVSVRGSLDGAEALSGAQRARRSRWQGSRSVRGGLASGNVRLPEPRPARPKTRAARPASISRTVAPLLPMFSHGPMVRPEDGQPRPRPRATRHDRRASRARARRRMRRRAPGAPWPDRRS